MNTKQRLVVTAGAAALVVSGATACSSASEEGIERLIESETGDDVELDLDGGGFSIDTDEGSITMDDEGNIVIEGQDGETITGNVDVDDGSIDIESDEGSFSMESDEDGSFTIESDEGTITGGSDEDGNFTIESDDGTFSIEEGGDIPDEWPTEVPTPDGLTIQSSSFMGDDESQVFTLTGTTSESRADAAGAYGAALESAGFDKTSEADFNGDVTLTFEDDTWAVVVGTTEIDGETQVSVSLFPAG